MCVHIYIFRLRRLRPPPTPPLKLVGTHTITHCVLRECRMMRALGKEASSHRCVYISLRSRPRRADVPSARQRTVGVWVCGGVFVWLCRAPGVRVVVVVAVVVLLCLILSE